MKNISRETVEYVRKNEKELAVVIEPYNSIKDLDIIVVLIKTVDNIIKSNKELSISIVQKEINKKYSKLLPKQEIKEVKKEATKQPETKNKKISNTLIELIKEIEKSKEELTPDQYIDILEKSKLINEELEKLVNSFKKNQDNEVIIPKKIKKHSLINLIEAYCLKNDLDIALEEEMDNEYSNQDIVYTDDSIELYLKEINKIPLLPKEEAYNLAVSSKTNKEAFNKLTEANLRLVVSIAKKYLGRGMGFLDLIQEGNLGLIKAIEKYDPEKGYTLATYATWWIRQAVSRSIADKSRTVRIPVHEFERINKLGRIEKAFFQKNGRDATLEELAIEMNVSIKKIEELKKNSMEIVSLETPIGEEDDSILSDFIKDESIIEPEKYALQILLKQDIDNALEGLTEREQEIIRLRFGLGYGEVMTLDEIGKIFGVTRERIRQIEATALRKLRNPARSKKLKSYVEN